MLRAVPDLDCVIVSVGGGAGACPEPDDPDPDEPEPDEPDPLNPQNLGKQGAQHLLAWRAWRTLDR